ncbi:LysM peptidoglycan-binding domain-containing protein [Nocardioides sp. YJ-D4]
MIAMRVRGLIACLAILVLLVGAPVAMLRLGAIPNLDGFAWRDLLRQDNGTLALQVITAAAWVAWAWFTTAILLEVAAQLRGLRTPRFPVLPQATAGRLVGAAIALFIAVPIAAPASTPAPAAAAPPPPEPQRPTPAVAPVEAAPARSTSHSADRTPTITYTVTRGDSLWRIAERHLGSGTRFTEIIDLNPESLSGDADFLPIGLVLRLPAPPTADKDEDNEAYVVRPGDTLADIAEKELHDEDRYGDIFEASRTTIQPDGTQLTDPDIIRPGWTLTIPGPESPKVGPRPTAPPEQDGRPQHPAPPSGHRDPVPMTPAPAPTVDAPDTTPERLEEESGDEPDSSPAWLVPGLVGAGAVLAGGLMLVLRRHHRSRRRYRLPGYEITPPPAELRPIEKTIRAEGTSTAALIERLDAVLHMLPREEHPRLVAAELGDNRIRLHLAEPVTLPHPWTGGPTVWTAPADAESPDGSRIAPYPLLASIGQTDDGHLWLLNLEELGVINLTGHREHADALVRHLAAELTVTPWSMLVQVDTHGIAGELARIDPDRLRHHEETDFLADITAELDTGGRLPGFDPDRYRAVLLAKDSVAGRTVPEAIATDAERTGAAVIILDALPDLDAAAITVTRDGHLSVSHPALQDVRIRAAGLTSDEAIACAAIVEVTREAEKCPMPRAQSATHGMEAFIDAAGALRPEYVSQRPSSDLEPAGQSSLLPEPTKTYVAQCATTSEDVRELAPIVDAAAREAVSALDPTLDHDIAEWHSPESRLPKLTLLGPVHLRAHGSVPPARRPYFAELLAYLVLHPDGVRTAEYLEAIGVSRSRLTIDLGKLRNWLGKNPRTGKSHLQDARRTPASKRLGYPAYQAEDILVDLDLFRRLRARGESRGADGITDLHQALRLITGEPFTQMRERGWSWLLDGQRHDHIAVSMIVDTAHLVVNRALAEHAYESAREAAQIAMRAAPYDDVPRLDHARVLAATGHQGLAEQQLGEDIFNRDDGDGPTEPPQRSKRVAG